jgi:hypothetical protein
MIQFLEEAFPFAYTISVVALSLSTLTEFFIFQNASHQFLKSITSVCHPSAHKKIKKTNSRHTGDITISHNNNNNMCASALFYVFVLHLEIMHTFMCTHKTQ